jgi:hypothetical protein
MQELPHGQTAGLSVRKPHSEKWSLYVVWLTSALAVSLPIALKWLHGMDEHIPSLEPTTALEYGILAVLNSLAYSIYKDRQLRSELASKVDSLKEGTGVVSIFSSWNDSGVKALISSATESLVIVDTWYDEATELARLIADAKAHAPGDLKVDVYMLSEASPFGEQRKREIAGGRPIDSSGAAYAQSFGEGVAALRGNVGAVPGVRLALYRYTTMPGLRLTVVDERKYVFSWFPFGTYSVNNVCLMISTDAVSRVGLEAITCLRRQLKGIKSTATEI